MNKISNSSQTSFNACFSASYLNKITASSTKCQRLYRATNMQLQRGPKPAERMPVSWPCGQELLEQFTSIFQLEGRNVADFSDNTKEKKSEKKYQINE